jgi:hypothetical protein
MEPQGRRGCPGFVERGRGDPDPGGAGPRGRDAAQLTEVGDALGQGNLGLGRLRADAGDVIAAEQADDPVRPLSQRRRPAAQHHRAAVRRQPRVGNPDPGGRPADGQQVPKDVRPGQQVVGHAVADGEHQVAGLERQGVDLGRHGVVGQQVGGRLPGLGVEAGHDLGMLATIRERRPRESVLGAFQRIVLTPRGVLADHDPEQVERLAVLARVIADSPALQRRGREILDGYTTSLAALIAEETGAAPNDITPRVIANALMGVHRALSDHTRELIVAGVRNPQLAHQVRAQAERAFATLAQGLDTTPRREPDGYPA